MFVFGVYIHWVIAHTHRSLNDSPNTRETVIKIGKYLFVFVFFSVSLSFISAFFTCECTKGAIKMYTWVLQRRQWWRFYPSFVVCFYYLWPITFIAVHTNCIEFTLNFGKYLFKTKKKTQKTQKFKKLRSHKQNGKYFARNNAISPEIGGMSLYVCEVHIFIRTACSPSASNHPTFTKQKHEKQRFVSVWQVIKISMCCNYTENST